MPDIRSLVIEYTSLLTRNSEATTDNQIAALLVRDSSWTEKGAREILLLAKRYGTFMLANSLALASAMDIEDGDSGY